VISENNLSDVQVIKDIIRKEFGECHYQNLYLIGGALRFIGRFYMDFAHYPLKNLHNLEIPSADFEIYLEKLDRIHKIKPTYEHRKIDYNATLIAKAMLEVFSPEKVIISNYGLKEGVRFISLSREEQEKNIIYERVKALVKLDADIYNKLSKYSKVIHNLLIAPDSTILSIVDLTIMLSHFNKNIDKTLRANFAVEFILSSDIPFSHRQRLMLSLALAFAYSSKSDTYINKLAKKMLSKADYYNSQIIGNFIRIAKKVDGPEFHAPSFALQLKDKYIEITTAEILPQQTFKKVCERLQDIAYARKMSRTSNTIKLENKLEEDSDVWVK
jgi:exopolyphosphatase/guanosine-5'-triphosphate,3'-diphosphate pyrophosphatase